MDVKETENSLQDTTFQAKAAVASKRGKRKITGVYPDKSDLFEEWQNISS
jgi:hypothetical protein